MKYCSLMKAYCVTKLFQVDITFIDFKFVKWQNFGILTKLSSYTHYYLTAESGILLYYRLIFYVQQRISNLHDIIMMYKFIFLFKRLS